MIQLTPDNLAEFVEDAQRFLNRGPTDVSYEGVRYGRGHQVTVEVVRMGTISGAQFNLEGIRIDLPVFPKDSDYTTTYQITDSRLVVQQITDRTREAIFTLT